jgi:hypothetical protein
VYGLLNFPSRNTYTITAPTAAGWVPQDTITEVLAMKQALIGDKMYGPYYLYVGNGWSQYLDNDYSAANPTQATLRSRLMMIEGLQGIRTLDHLTGFQMVLVQMTSDNMRTVIGMDITTLQWETNGGLEMHYKVMAIMVPQMRADPNGNSGIVHANV